MLTKWSEVVMFALPALYFMWQTPPDLRFLLLATVASMFTFLNYFFISAAYTRGNLSIMYPISRSSLLFLPFLSWIFMDERMDAFGIAGVVLITIGTLLMILPSFSADGLGKISKELRKSGTLYAVLAALTVALYTMWDKMAIQELPPFLYLYLYTAFVTLIYSTYVGLKHSTAEVRSEWALNKKSIIQVGFFNVFTYMLVLYALKNGKTTYVGGLRQLSVVVGVFLAYRYLKESLSAPVITGLIVSLIGSLLIYFSK
jgi:transporter family protein